MWEVCLGEAAARPGAVGGEAGRGQPVRALAWGQQGHTGLGATPLQ